MDELTVRLAKALHDVAHPIMDSSDDAPVPKGPEPLCLDPSCLCVNGFCFCPDDPGCLDLDDDGDGKHFNICIEARKALTDFVNRSKEEKLQSFSLEIARLTQTYRDHNDGQDCDENCHCRTELDEALFKVKR